MNMVIPNTRQQLCHVSGGVMYGIHVCSRHMQTTTMTQSPLRSSEKEGQYFDFNGKNHTIWLAESKRAALLTILHGWLRSAEDGTRGIPFLEFESVVAKCLHVFTSMPAGKGLLSYCNTIVRRRPAFVYLHQNQELHQSIKDNDDII